jgi:hypothetical protein
MKPSEKIDAIVSHMLEVLAKVMYEKFDKISNGNVDAIYELLKNDIEKDQN